MPFTGQCLCGGVAFTIEGDVEPIQICHCSQCRKAQGSAFVAVIPVATSSFRVVQGESLLSSFESSPGKQRLFCSRCGSPILSRRQALPEVVRIRAGLINEPLPVGIAWHAYTASKANWWPIADGAPRYTGAYVGPDT